MTVQVFQVDHFGPLEPFDVERQALASVGAELVTADCFTEAELIAQAGEAEILWLAWRYGVITPDALASLPRCRLIVRWGVGYDQFDVPSATALGVAVANAPSYGTEDVAEHAIALLLSWARRVSWLDHRLHAGEWPIVAALPIHRLKGRTLGIVGLGRIGSAVARRAQGLGLRVIAADPAHTADEMRRRGAEPRDLDALLEEADYVSLHVPLLESTRFLIDSERLARMRPDALLINTSRGRVVDTQALLAALDSHRLAGAALDVFEEEPLPADSPLRGRDDLVLTSHAGGFSLEAWDDLRQEMCETAKDWIRDGWSKSIVNPAVRDALRPVRT